MATIVEQLTADHERLKRGAETFNRVAGAIGTVPAGELSALLEEAVGFLRAEVIPHDRREELVLHPLLCERLGGAEAARIITRDHEEIEYLAEELSLIQRRLASSGQTSSDEPRLRRALQQLDSLITLHFKKEEEIAFPLLAEDVAALKTTTNQ